MKASIDQLNRAVDLIIQASDVLKQTHQATSLGQLSARETAKESLQAAIYEIQSEIIFLESRRHDPMATARMEA